MGNGCINTTKPRTGLRKGTNQQKHAIATSMMAVRQKIDRSIGLAFAFPLDPYAHIHIRMTRAGAARKSGLRLGADVEVAHPASIVAGKHGPSTSRDVGPGWIETNSSIRFIRRVGRIKARFDRPEFRPINPHPLPKPKLNPKDWDDASSLTAHRTRGTYASPKTAWRSSRSALWHARARSPGGCLRPRGCFVIVT